MQYGPVAGCEYPSLFLRYSSLHDLIKWFIALVGDILFPLEGFSTAVEPL